MYRDVWSIAFRVQLQTFYLVANYFQNFGFGGNHVVSNTNSDIDRHDTINSMFGFCLLVNTWSSFHLPCKLFQLTHFSVLIIGNLLNVT